MATQPSPMAGMLQQLIASRLGGGQGGPASLSQVNPEAIGQAVSSQHSELQNVDPAKIVQDLNRMKAEASALFPVAVMRVADAAKGISQAVTGLNSAIKAFEKAQETLKNVHPPLGMQAAQLNPSGGGEPGPMGAPGAQPPMGAM